MHVPHPRRWLILFVVLAAECMDLLDGTVVNVAAPTIHRDLGRSSTALQWIVGGYPLALAVGLVIGGRLGDLYGRRRMFLARHRGLHGRFGALRRRARHRHADRGAARSGLRRRVDDPAGLGLLREAFPSEELPKAFGVFGPVMGSAALLGPIIGGALVSATCSRPAGARCF